MKRAAVLCKKMFCSGAFVWKKKKRKSPFDRLLNRFPSTLTQLTSIPSTIPEPLRPLHTLSYQRSTYTPFASHMRYTLLSLPPLLVLLRCHIWARKTAASVFTDEVKAEKSRRRGGQKRKKISPKLQTNPPGEILFQCTLHFVALMPALNCFGTCHKYWWNSFSL